VTHAAEGEPTQRMPQTPQAAGVAGTAFAVPSNLTVVALRRVAPPDPQAAGLWLTLAGSRRGAGW